MIPLSGFANITSGPNTSAFYIENIRFDNGPKLVPFKAYVSTPTSVFFLHILVPEEIEIEEFEDEEGEELTYWPGEDIAYQYVYNGEVREHYCDLIWERSDSATTINGKAYHSYYLILSGVKKHSNNYLMKWQPVSYFMPSEHYSMFSLLFVDRDNDLTDSEKIGDIYITTYSVNYSHITSKGLAKDWFYSYRVYRDGHYYDQENGEWIGNYYDRELELYYDIFYHYYFNPDANGDQETNIADYNTMNYILLRYGPESGEYYQYTDVMEPLYIYNRDFHAGDINLDGYINLVDYALWMDVIKYFMFGDSDAQWYSGYIVEQGTSTATIKRIRCGDADGDGIININDVTTLIQHLLSHNNTINIDNADIDDDGRLSISDVTALINYLLSGSW